jgi:hypothetical protein
MDPRPAGPRHPAQHQHQPVGDKRSAAYQSIFGRPTLNVPQQQQQQQPALNYSPSVRASQHPQPNGLQHHNQQQYQSHLDRRISQPSFAQSHPHYPAQQQQQPYRKSFDPSTTPQTQYPSYHQGRPSSLAPPSVHARARSLASAPHTAGVIDPRPEEPLDASLDPLTHAGLTPAQAYQAQVYLNSPAGQQSGWNGQGNLPAAALRPSSLPPGNGASSQPLVTRSAIDVPTLGISLESDDGRLGIDFLGSSPSDQDTDEGSSELPWASPASQHSTRGFSFLFYLTLKMQGVLIESRLFPPRVRIKQPIQTCSCNYSNNDYHKSTVLLDRSGGLLAHTLSNLTLLSCPQWHPQWACPQHRRLLSIPR